MSICGGSKNSSANVGSGGIGNGPHGTGERCESPAGTVQTGVNPLVQLAQVDVANCEKRRLS